MHKQTNTKKCWISCKHIDALALDGSIGLNLYWKKAAWRKSRRGITHGFQCNHSVAMIFVITQGLYSLSGRTSYCKIAWCLEARTFGLRLFQSLWNLTGTSVVALSKFQSGSIRSCSFETSCEQTYAIVLWCRVSLLWITSVQCLRNIIVHFRVWIMTT